MERRGLLTSVGPGSDFTREAPSAVRSNLEAHGRAPDGEADVVAGGAGNEAEVDMNEAAGVAANL
jgi:hypothetical protein